jgi:hypothetical protein
MRRIDSTNSTWLFDIERMRFCRLPRGVDPSLAPPHGEWQAYYGLEIELSGAFTIALNSDHTRLLRAWQENHESTKELELQPEARAEL